MRNSGCFLNQRLHTSTSLASVVNWRSISTETFRGFEPSASILMSKQSTILEDTLERTHFLASSSAVAHKVSICSVDNSGIPSSSNGVHLRRRWLINWVEVFLEFCLRLFYLAAHSLFLPSQNRASCFQQLFAFNKLLGHFRLLSLNQQ